VKRAKRKCIQPLVFSTAPKGTVRKIASLVRKRSFAAVLVRLSETTAQANAAIDEALTLVEDSNKRIEGLAGKPRYRLSDLLAQVPPGRIELDEEMQAWENMPLVGREIL